MYCDNYFTGIVIFTITDISNDDYNRQKFQYRPSLPTSGIVGFNWLLPQCFDLSCFLSEQCVEMHIRK